MQGGNHIPSQSIVYDLPLQSCWLTALTLAPRLTLALPNNFYLVECALLSPISSAANPPPSFILHLANSFYSPFNTEL